MDIERGRRYARLIDLADYRARLEVSLSACAQLRVNTEISPAIQAHTAQAQVHLEDALQKTQRLIRELQLL